MLTAEQQEFANARRSATTLGQPLDEVVEHRRSGRRWCGKCRSWQDLDQFTLCRARSRGIAPYCRACHATRCALRPSRAKAHEPRAPRTPTPPLTSGSMSCGTCLAAAPFVLTDGTPACARCLKARVKERKTR